MPLLVSVSLKYAYNTPLLITATIDSARNAMIALLLIMYPSLIGLPRMELLGSRDPLDEVTI